MNYIDYVQLNIFQRFWYKFKIFITSLPRNIVKFFMAIGRFFKLQRNRFRDRKRKVLEKAATADDQKEGNE